MKMKYVKPDILFDDIVLKHGIVYEYRCTHPVINTWNVLIVYIHTCCVNIMK